MFKVTRGLDSVEGTRRIVLEHGVGRREGVAKLQFSVECLCSGGIQQCASVEGAFDDVALVVERPVIEA